MKTEKNILIAFILNIVFSIFELIGGILTKSISIISDAIHDFCDAISIGISYFLEKISKKKPDNRYTFGYLRYSVIGAVITNMILIIGSIFIIYNSFKRIINPVNINYDGMILFAIIGLTVNFLAAYVTRDGKSLNQKAVNLHMLEDVLGWGIVLIGALLIKVTKIFVIDAIMSILVALYILYNALKSFRKIFELFLEKTPNNIDINELKNDLLKINNILDVHHIHVWSLDSINNYSTMHVVTIEENLNNIKLKVKEELKKHGINHVTIEIENEDYLCEDKNCLINNVKKTHNHHK